MIKKCKDLTGYDQDVMQWWLADTVCRGPVLFVKGHDGTARKYCFHYNKYNYDKLKAEMTQKFGEPDYLWEGEPFVYRCHSQFDDFKDVLLDILFIFLTIVLIMPVTFIFTRLIFLWFIWNIIFIGYKIISVKKRIKKAEISQAGIKIENQVYDLSYIRNIFDGYIGGGWSNWMGCKFELNSVEYQAEYIVWISALKSERYEEFIWFCETWGLQDGMIKYLSKYDEHLRQHNQKDWEKRQARKERKQLLKEGVENTEKENRL